MTSQPQPVPHGSSALSPRAVGGDEPSTAPAHHGGSALHRFAAYDVAEHAVPTGREEQWRFTPLRRLRGLHDGKAERTGKVDLEVDAAPEVRVEQVGRSDARIGASGYVPVDRVSAQAWSSFDVAQVLTVPTQVRASRPTVVSVNGLDAQGAAYGHTVLVAEPYAEAVLVLDHGGAATYADNVEIMLGEGARLSVVAVHDWADESTHVTHHHARIGRDATLRHVAVSFGGDLVRLSASVGYDGPGGDAELLGLYFADSGQHLEHRLFVDHSAARCRSNVLYKGALQGASARTVWVGDVLIRPTAVGTNTYELNRNLVLSDGARADSVPNLEIETGEVEGAGHASATGRFDDEQLFYLQARGIPAVEARRLVVRGFFAELIARIGVPELRERLVAKVERELTEAVL